MAQSMQRPKFQRNQWSFRHIGCKDTEKNFAERQAQEHLRRAEPPLPWQALKLYLLRSALKNGEQLCREQCQSLRHLAAVASKLLHSLALWRDVFSR